MRPGRKVTILSLGVVLAAVVVLFPYASAYRKWQLWRLSRFREAAVLQAKSRELTAQDECFQELLRAGVVAFPDIFRVWVESTNLKVLMIWEKFLREQHDRGSPVCSLPQLDQSLSTKECIEKGLDVEISTEGTNFAGHGFATFNPIIPFEAAFGPGTWPTDLPLERIQNPVKWNLPHSLEGFRGVFPTVAWRRRFEEGDPWFTEAALRESDQVLHQFLTQLSEARGNEEKMLLTFQVAVTTFDRLNVKHSSFVESLEHDELVEFFNNVADHVGLKYPDGDITWKWRRNW